MAATALIQLTQGGNVGTAGQALFGSVGTQVDIANNDNSLILSWQIDILYVPPGSSISVGTLAFSDNSSTPVGSFTPDLRGPYRLQLKVWNAINRSGNPTDTDIRNFGIKEANGIYRPAPEIWPRPLPPTASGLPGNKPDENNFAGQPNGWSGDGSDGLLDTALQRIDKAVRIAAGTQSASTGTVILSDSNGISFGMAGSSRITASYTVPSVAGLISAVNVSGGTTSNNLSAIVFSNANNFSFGLNGSTITGSYTVPVVTNSTATISAGTKSETLSNLVFSNSNGLSFGLSNGTITGSYTVPNVPAQTVQTQNIVVPAGSNTTYTSGTVVFTGSNAVTIRSTTGQAIVIDVPVQSAQTQNIVVPSAGTQTATSGTVVFSDSNGISFGMSGSTRITASYTVPSTAGLISNVNFSAGTTSNDGKSFVFSNSNNVSFGLNGSTITATISIPAQTNQTEGRYAIGNTTGQSSSSTFDARTLSISGTGIISVGYSGNALVISATTVAQTVQTQSNVQGISAGTQVGRTGDIVFSNSNGVTFGMSGSNTVTASHNGLTVAIQSISAGTTRATNGEVVFSNSNGISFGMNAGTITATVNPGAAAGIAAIQGGTQTATSGTVVFSDSNGISFGLSGSSRMTASYTVPSTAGLISAVNFSAGTTSNNASAIVYSNSNGVSFGLNGSTITGSVATSLTALNVSAGTTSNNLSAIVFSNSNNFSFGLNGSTVTGSYTVPTQTVQTVGLYGVGNTTQNSSTTLDARTISFNGLGAMTVGYSNGSVQLSVPVQTAQTQSNVQAFYDGANSISTGTIRVSNSNGVSFGINGQTLTASVAAQTNQTVGLYALGNTTQNSSTTLDARTLSFNGLGAATVGYSNGSIQISVPNALTNINISAGTTSNNLTALVFSNSNNVSFGLNGSTVTATITVPAQTNQTVGLYALGNTTQNSSTTLDARTLSFNGLGIITAGYSNGSIQISATQSVQTQSLIQAIYDGANSITTGTIRFTNANGVSFSINGQTISGSVAAQTNQTIGLYALGNTTQNSSTTLDARTLSFNGLGGNTVGYSNGSIQISGVTTNNLISAVNFSAGTTSTNAISIVFSNSNNFTFGINGATITASFNGANAGIAAVSAGTQSKTSGTLIFSNSNNITFGMAGSNTITASYSQSAQTVGLFAVGNTTQNSSTTLDARTLSFNAIGGLSVGYSNGSVQLSAPGASSISVTGALSISVNADTISLGVPVRNVSHLMWPEVPWGTNFSISNASLSLQHFNPAVDMTASQANFLMALAGNTNSTGALTVSMGIYTMSGSTMSLASSDSRAITWTSGSQTTNSTVYGGISGTRYRTLALANWAITAGDYMLGVWFRTTNDGTWRAFGIQGPTIVGAIDANETNQYFNGFSTSSFTTAMIASVNVTATNFVRTGGPALQQPSMIFLGSF